MQRKAAYNAGYLQAWVAASAAAQQPIVNKQTPRPCISLPWQGKTRLATSLGYVKVLFNRVYEYADTIANYSRRDVVILISCMGRFQTMRVGACLRCQASNIFSNQLKRR